MNDVKGVWGQVGWHKNNTEAEMGQVSLISGKDQEVRWFASQMFQNVVSARCEGEATEAYLTPQ